MRLILTSHITQAVVTNNNALSRLTILTITKLMGSRYITPRYITPRRHVFPYARHNTPRHHYSNTLINTTSPMHQFITNHPTHEHYTSPTRLPVTKISTEHHLISSSPHPGDAASSPRTPLTHYNHRKGGLHNPYVALQTTITSPKTRHQPYDALRPRE